MTAWRSIRDKIQEMDVTYVLAVSGGVDSMVMLDFFTRCDVPIIVAHFNHNLQPINADMEKHVVEYCVKRNIEHYVGQGKSIEHNSKILNTSVEAEARRQRYEFLDVLCKMAVRAWLRPAMITTAHHQNDQIETVLLNLFRGVGLQSVYMKELSGNRFRPFLSVTKDDLVDSATKRKISWVEDPTNAENDAERNWLRNDIIPQIMTHRNISKTVPLSISKFEDYLQGLNQLTK